MSNKEKSIYIIDFLSSTTNGESWSKKFFSHGKQKRYKKLQVSSGSMSGMNNIPTHNGYENAMEGDTDLDKKM